MVRTLIFGVGCIVSLSLSLASCVSEEETEKQEEKQEKVEENKEEKKVSVAKCCTEACSDDCRATCQGKGHQCDKDPKDRECCVGPDGKKKERCCDSQYSNDQCCQEV